MQGSRKDTNPLFFSGFFVTNLCHCIFFITYFLLEAISFSPEVVTKLIDDAEDKKPLFQLFGISFISFISDKERGFAPRLGYRYGYKDGPSYLKDEAEGVQLTLQVKKLAQAIVGKFEPELTECASAEEVKAIKEKITEL